MNVAPAKHKEYTALLHNRSGSGVYLTSKGKWRKEDARISPELRGHLVHECEPRVTQKSMDPRIQNL